MLNSKKVKYLLVGGYAVSYHGYPRSTGDMDIWIETDKSNAAKVKESLQEFGIPAENISPDILMNKDTILRMGIPPVRLEIITSASGVNFDECFEKRVVVESGDLKVNLISLKDLKTNKKASGRFKDLEDLKNLP